jgi:hypothetical protein
MRFAYERANVRGLQREARNLFRGFVIRYARSKTKVARWMSVLGLCLRVERNGGRAGANRPTASGL